MAQVRYLGWTSREPREDHGGVMSAQLRKSVTLPDDSRLVVRGRAGSPSQWQTVPDRFTDLFLESDEWEVRNG